jgi:hypothetical protein
LAPVIAQTAVITEPISPDPVVKFHENGRLELVVTKDQIVDASHQMVATAEASLENGFGITSEDEDEALTSIIRQAAQGTARSLTERLIVDTNLTSQVSACLAYVLTALHIPSFHMALGLTNKPLEGLIKTVKNEDLLQNSRASGLTAALKNGFSWNAEMVDKIIVRTEFNPAIMDSEVSKEDIMLGVIKELYRLGTFLTYGSSGRANRGLYLMDRLNAIGLNVKPGHDYALAITDHELFNKFMDTSGFLAIHYDLARVNPAPVKVKAGDKTTHGAKFKCSNCGARNNLTHVDKDVTITDSFDCPVCHTPEGMKRTDIIEVVGKTLKDRLNDLYGG